MKSTIVSKVTPAVVLAVVLAVASTVRAQNIISWSFDRYGFDNAPGWNGGLPVPNTTAGVIPAINWNDGWNENGAQPSATVNNLWDNSGANSGASIIYSSSDGWQINWSHAGPDADGTYNRELLNGYIDSGSPNSTTIAISSIPYSSYEIIVYLSSDQSGRAGTANIGSTTYDFSTLGSSEVSGANALFTQTTDTTGANPAADYATFTGLTGSSQTITVLVNGGGGIPGFQIVAVPEPGTLALAAMGGIGVLLFGRRIRR